MLRHYEVVIIFQVGLEEEQMRAVLDRVSAAISEQGGAVGRIDRWGRRRFAYEIDHRWEGYYVVVEATAEPPGVEAVQRILSLADEVVRHKVVRVPSGSVARQARPRTPAPVSADPS